MKIFFIKSVNVFKDNDIFLAHIGYKNYDLGIQIHKWGIRFMLIWWHCCITFEK
jgi:hypothetical protein